MKHNASCCCGQLQLTYEGEIKRTSMCHCFACQKRTGSVFAVQTRLDKNKVAIQGQSTEYVRIGDEGNKIRFHFCPQCGSTVFYYLDIEGYTDSVAVAIGAFANPELPAPVFSVYKARKHHWVTLPDSVVEDWD